MKSENKRMELFAQGLAKGELQVDAYEKAGYARSIASASRLARQPQIKKRVAELLERGAKKTMVTIEKLTQELEDARVLSMKDEKGAAAAVSAIMAKAKLHGLDVNRHEVSGAINIIISSDDAKL